MGDEAVVTVVVTTGFTGIMTCGTVVVVVVFS